ALPFDGWNRSCRRGRNRTEELAALGINSAHRKGPAAKKDSKVDILARKKKLEKMQSLSNIERGLERKQLGKTEANLAGRATVENAGALKLVSCTPQVLAKAKDIVGGRNKMRGRKKAAWLGGPLDSIRCSRLKSAAERMPFFTIVSLASWAASQWGAIGPVLGAAGQRAFAANLTGGRRICVLWNDGEDWQVRVLLTPATAGDFEEVMGITAIDDPEMKSRIWYALSPDGDTYLHLLAAPSLGGLCLADSTDRFDPTLGEGRRWSRRSRTYGEDWAPTPLEFSRAIRFAVMGDSDGSAPAHRMTGKKPMAAGGVKALTVATDSSATRGRPAGAEVEVGAGMLENPAPFVWQVICMSDGALGPQTLEDCRVDSWATIGDVGVAKVGVRIFLFRAVDKKTASEGGANLDARAMPVLGIYSSERRRVFRDAVKLLQESQ
ncbi:unnamed protein product, partial [Prorocentrum cordatum]